jgi:DNA-binding transcriptional LysR family regulator
MSTRATRVSSSSTFAPSRSSQSLPRGFLPFPITEFIGPEQMREQVQCIIRDSARHSAPRDYYVVEGALSWTVSDQLMKKEVIHQGMGWGHLPDFLISEELGSGRLLSIKGKHLPGGRVDLVAARQRNVAHGPVAESLWRFFVSAQAPLTGTRNQGAAAAA